MTITNILNNRRNAGQPWVGFSCFLLYSDRDGKPFSDRSAKYVAFDNHVLIGEFETLKASELAFLREEKVIPNVRLRDYLGISEELRAAWGA